MQADGERSRDDLELRLRAALADTHEQPPRPIAPLILEQCVPASDSAEQWLTTLRPAAVLAPLIRRADGLHVLLTRRADHLRSHQGQVSFPGGGREAHDRSAQDTALREAQEEIGLDQAHVEVIGYLDDYPTFTRYRITPVVGIICGEPVLQHDQGEVAEMFEVPLSLLLDPANYERKRLVRDGMDAEFYEVRYVPQRIWGATAGILRNLCRIVTGL